MHLGGRYLIIMAGLDGTRRTDIAHLLAGGAAYLSTVTEFTESPDAQASAGVKPSYHTKVTVLSTLDCFEGKRGQWKYDHDYLPQAREDVKRRCELAMSREVSIIILDDSHLERWEITPYLELAERYEYEVIALSTHDARVKVMEKRREMARRAIPDEVHARDWDRDRRQWSVLQDEDGGTFVNEEDHRGRLIQPDRGEPSQVVPEASDTQGSQEEATTEVEVKVSGIHDRSQVGLTNAWRFVKEMTGCKMHEARIIISEALAAEDDFNHDVPTIRVPKTPASILRRADELGVRVTID